MSATPEPAASRRTILVVDDQESVRKSLEYLLELAGYNVVCAESGAKAIALAAADSVDGALIDVHMPAMNGFDTCLCLQDQARKCGRELRVWFMTGAFTKSFDRRSAEFGALGVLSKPFNCVGFLAELERGFSSPLPVSTLTTPAVGDNVGANTPS